MATCPTSRVACGSGSASIFWFGPSGERVKCEATVNLPGTDTVPLPWKPEASRVPWCTDTFAPPMSKGWMSIGLNLKVGAWPDAGRV